MAPHKTAYQLSTNVSVDARSISTLTDALSRLQKNSGSLTVGELWPVEIEEADSYVQHSFLCDYLSHLHGFSYFDSIGCFEDGLYLLDALKGVQTTLDVLFKTLRCKIRSFQGKLIPASRSVGLSKLPNETLGSILQYCLADSYYSELETRKNIATVCVRFRDVLAACSRSQSDAGDDLPLDLCSTGWPKVFDTKRYKSLTECTIGLSYNHLDDLVKFLQSTPSLNSLHISFENNRDVRKEDATFTLSGSFPNLATCTIKHLSQIETHCLVTFLQYMHSTPP